MEIYFAGPIRGGRDGENKRAAKMIIEVLRKFGNVLTEHIADETLSSFGETNIKDGDIYQRDISWLREADLVVAEVSTPSLGVGYEIGVAESMGKKILCLYRGGNISAMICGNPNLAKIEYDFTDLEDKITELMINHGGSGMDDGKD